MFVTVGDRTVELFEFEPVMNLNPKKLFPGSKLLVDNIMLKRGMLALTPKSFIKTFGECKELQDTYAARTNYSLQQKKRLELKASLKPGEEAPPLYNPDQWNSWGKIKEFVKKKRQFDTRRKVELWRNKQQGKIKLTKKLHTI
eukprot:UN30333